MSTVPSVPFNLPSIGDEEIAEVVATLRSGWLTSGPRTARFEQEFRDYVRAPFALAVNSCTAGLHLALASLEIGPGAEVITTPLTFCATVNTILEVGATPVLADIGPDLNLDPAAAAAAVTPRTRAIVPVHMAGLPCDLDPLWSLARAHDLRVIEDAAHAAGSHYKGAPIGGGRSDATAFSFYATKNLSTGEGGMLTTSSEALYDRMRLLCLHGISRGGWDRYTDKGTWYYQVMERGYKYNFSDILAAIGIQQLRKLDAMNARRAEIARRYNDAFRDMPELELPPDRRDCRHCWHLYILRLRLPRLRIDRAEFVERLRESGIGTSVHFIPIPLHPAYRGAVRMPDACTRALAEYPRLISLPLYSAMSGENVERVIEAVRTVVAHSRTHVFQAVATAHENAAN